MTEEQYKLALIDIEKRKIALEESKFTLENTFLKRHIIPITTTVVMALATVMAAIIGKAVANTNETLLGNARILAATTSGNTSNPSLLEIINPVGTLGRFDSISGCSIVPKTPLDPQGKIMIGLVGTTTSRSPQSAVIEANSGAEQKSLEIPVGSTHVLTIGGFIYNISVQHVDNCTADYRIHTVQQVPDL